jgi:SAM-dependent methyltransferase
MNAYASHFWGESAALADRYSLPFPANTMDIVRSLIPASCPRVLDVGSGTGAVARALVDPADVWALDRSSHMLSVGRTLPRGDHPRLRWQQGTAEATDVEVPFGLIVVARCFHILDWDTVLPRFAKMLAPDGTLAVVYVHERGGPDLRALERGPFPNPVYHNYNWVAQLRERGLFTRHGWRRTPWTPYRTSYLNFIEGCHALRGLSREELGWDGSLAFDTQLNAALAQQYPQGEVELELAGSVIWGKPHA